MASAAASLAGVVGVLVVTGGQGKSVRPSTALATPVASARASAASPTREVLELPPGSALQGFVPTGFPHTELGAESAAWRWSALMLSLDPDASAAAARVWASPAYVDAPVQMAQAALSARSHLGLPPAGSPGAVFLVVQPLMVRLVVEDPSQPVVDVLVKIDAGGASGARSSRIDVVEFYLGWESGLNDWRVRDHPLDPQRAADTDVQPGSAEAYAMGWRDASSNS
jgi:hypothetical protein